MNATIWCLLVAGGLAGLGLTWFVVPRIGRAAAALFLIGFRDHGVDDRET